MHDDLMDRAPLRRGKSTVHTLWNDNTAVLSGDAMLIEAYKQIARTAPNVLPAVLEKFSHTASQICCGQQLDMEFEQRFDVSFQEYLQMIELKTAVLPAVALELGALTAGAPHSDCSHLYHFGIQLGLAFQLQDDLLDVYGNEAEFGKNIGGDILCNKKTALLTQALANTDCKDNLLYWLQLSTSDAAEKIEAVRTIYNQLNLKQRVESQIIEYYNTAFKHLEFLHAPDDRKVELLTFAHTLTGRNN
jgi:geranylgeranyl diphosphate synthase type II